MAEQGGIERIVLWMEKHNAVIFTARLNTRFVHFSVEQSKQEAFNNAPVCFQVSVPALL